MKILNNLVSMLMPNMDNENLYIDNIRQRTEEIQEERKFLDQQRMLLMAQTIKIEQGILDLITDL